MHEKVFIEILFCSMKLCFISSIYSQTVYKGHSREPELVPFMNSCLLYTGSNYIHYSLMGNEAALYRL